MHIKSEEAVKRERVIDLSIPLLVLSAVSFILFRTQADPDLWGHIKFGLDILRTGTIIGVDPYSYLTSGQQWINHEWLSEILFASAWKIGGTVGLNTLKILVGLSVVLILYRYLSSNLLVPNRAAILTIFDFLLLYVSLAPIRPQIFTVLLFTLVMIVIMKAESKQYRCLWCLPLIIILWVNLHGGFLAGVGIICIWTVLQSIQNLNNWKQYLPPVITSILATCINPYGLVLLVFLAKTATIARPEIVDWQPIQIISITGFLYILLLSICIMGFIYTRTERKLVTVILFIVLALMPLIAIRHVSLFAIGAMILATPHLSSIWIRKKILKRNQLSSILMGSATVFTALLLLFLSFMHINTIVLARSIQYPTKAVALLRQSGVSGNIANEFDWGEYIIWHLGDQLKVSIDGRRETVYSQQIYTQNLNFKFGTGEWNALLKSYNTQMALINRSSATYNLLKLTPGWSLIYQDDSSALFARKDFKGFQQLQETAASFKPPADTGIFP